MWQSEITVYNVYNIGAFFLSVNVSYFFRNGSKNVQLDIMRAFCHVCDRLTNGFLTVTSL